MNYQTEDPVGELLFAIINSTLSAVGIGHLLIRIRKLAIVRLMKREDEKFRSNNREQQRVYACAIEEIIWKAQFVDKLESKHQISTEEVEQVLFTNPHIRRARKGHVKGEDLYTA